MPLDYRLLIDTISETRLLDSSGFNGTHAGRPKGHLRTKCLNHDVVDIVSPYWSVQALPSVTVSPINQSDP